MSARSTTGSASAATSSATWPWRGTAAGSTPTSRASAAPPCSPSNWPRRPADPVRAPASQAALADAAVARFQQVLLERLLALDSEGADPGYAHHARLQPARVAGPLQGGRRVGQRRAQPGEAAPRVRRPRPPHRRGAAEGRRKGGGKRQGQGQVQIDQRRAGRQRRPIPHGRAAPRRIPAAGDGAAGTARTAGTGGSARFAETESDPLILRADEALRKAREN